MNNLKRLAVATNLIYNKYSYIFDRIGHFLLTLFSLLLINTYSQNVGIISNKIIILLISLICAFLPIEGIGGVVSIYILLCYYNLSMISMGLVAIILIIIIIFYLRFKSSAMLYIMLIPIAIFFKVPLLIPVFIGFMYNPTSILSDVFGIVMYYVIALMSKFEGVSSTNIAKSINIINKNVFGNKSMLILLITASLATIITYVIKKIDNRYSTLLSINISTVVSYIILFILQSLFLNNVNIITVLIQMLVSLALINILFLLSNNLNYSKTSILDYEDDDYYYYVRAIPKVKLDESDGEEAMQEEYQENSSQYSPGEYTKELPLYQQGKVSSETREIISDYLNDRGE